MTIAPLAFYPDTNQWKVAGSSGAAFDSIAALATFHFGGFPPNYVSVSMPDGRPQVFQRVADYPVSVVERLANPNFDTLDVWGLTVGGTTISGGACTWAAAASANATQLGVKITIPGATYQHTTVVSSYTSGILKPQLLSPGPTIFWPSITAAGTFTARLTMPTDPVAGAQGTYRLGGTSTLTATVTSTSMKRVMDYACVLSADGLIWAPAGDINVMAYGVVADGVTDDTAALTNAISIAYGLDRKALLPAGRMRVTDRICDFLATGIVQIEGSPGRSILINEIMGAQVPMISIMGCTDIWNKNDWYLTAPAAQAARTLTMNDTSQFTVDQDILIKDFSQPIEYIDKIYSDDVTRASSTNGEINRVKSIDSPTQITLGSQLEFALNPRVVLAGTVSTTSGVNVVTGVGTAFDVDLVPHQYVYIAGVLTGGLPAVLKIRKIVSATVLWIDIAYTPISNTVSGATITKIGTVVQRFLDKTEAQISGVRIVGSTAVSIPTTNACYDFRGLRRFTVRDIGFIAVGCAELVVLKCLRGRILNYYSEDAGRTGTDSYCISISNGCRSIQIDNAYALRPRHLITTLNDEIELEASYVLLSNCHVDQPMLVAYDMHPGGRNWLWSNCSAQGADYDGNTTAGFQPRGHECTLVNCQVSGCTYGFNLAFGYNTMVDSCLAVGCETSLAVIQTHHVDVQNFISRNAKTHDVRIACRYNTAGSPPLPGIRIQGRGEGNPSGESVYVDAGYPWGDWEIDFRNPEATTKFSTIIPASYWPGNNFRELNVKEWGAKGDGVTDDAPAIKLALAQAMALRETLIIPKGVYYCGSPLMDSAINSYVKIRGDGEDTVLFTHVENDGLIKALATLTARSTLSAPATVGDRTITVVSTTGYVVDQDVEIKDLTQQIIDWSTGTTGTANKGEMNRVRSVVDATHLLLWSRLEDNYTIGTKVNTMTPTLDWDIRDLAFQHVPGAGIDAAQRGIQLTRAKRIYMENLVFRGFDSACIRLAYTIDGTFSNIRGESLYSSDGTHNLNPYLVLAAEGCNALQFDRLYLKQGRHCFTTGADISYIEPAHITVSDSMAYECMASGFDTHPGARRITFDNCEAWGGDQSTVTLIEGDGFQLRGRQNVMQNCRANAVRHGAMIANVEECSIINCDFTNCDNGIHLVNSPKALVQDVTIRNPKLRGVWFDKAAPGGVTIADIRLSDVTILGNPSTAAIDVVGWHDSYRLERVRSPDATIKFSASVPSSHSHGIIDKTANFTVSPNLNCVYRCTGTFTATLPLLAGETGETTYIFKVVSGVLTIDGNGAELIDGVASITPTGTVRVKKIGETGSWVSW